MDNQASGAPHYRALLTGAVLDLAEAILHLRTAVSLLTMDDAQAKAHAVAILGQMDGAIERATTKLAGVVER